MKASLNQTKGLNKHVQQLTGHMLDLAEYNGHGHVVERQGAKGHTMVPSNLHMQSDSHIPQAALSSIPANRQNESTDEGSADADAPSVADYGVADNGK